MKIEKDSAVRIHYHLTSPSGDIIDSSRGKDPLQYFHGHGQLVKGVEAALAGLVAGEQVSAIVPPDQGYGLRDPLLDVRVPMSAFPESMQPQVRPGGQFHGQHPEQPDKVAIFTVVAIEGDDVIATGNHQLAGVTLHFELEVVEVRQASRDELQQLSAS